MAEHPTPRGRRRMLGLLPPAKHALPRRPIYSDQRKWGVKLSTRAKVLLVLTTSLIVANALLGLYVVHYLSGAHDQAVRDREQLACLLVLRYPPNTPNDLARDIRATYPRCPYEPAASTPAGLPPTRAAVPSPSKPAVASPSKPPGAQQGPRATPAPASSRARSQRPAAPRTPTPRAPSTRTTPRAAPKPAQPPATPPPSKTLLCGLPTVGDPLCGLLGGLTGQGR